MTGRLPPMLLRLLAVAAMALADVATAQVTIDDFTSGALSTQLWSPSNRDHLGLFKANGRLEFRCTADPEVASNQFQFCTAHLKPALSTASDFQFTVKMNYQRQGATSDDVTNAMAESGVFLWFGGVESVPDATNSPDGIPPGLRIAYGSFVRNGVEYRTLDVTSINDRGEEEQAIEYLGSGSVLFNRFTDGQHGPAFASIPPGQPLRVTVSHSIDAQMNRVVLLTLNGSITLTLLDEPADDNRPIRCALGGYTRGPVKARNGAKAWFDDVGLAIGSLTYPPTNVVASQGSSTGDVKLTWTAAPGATGYRVYRLPNLQTPIATPTGTGFNDTGAPVGTLTQYAVAAMSSAGESGREVAAGWRAPQAPTSLTASDGSSPNSVQLNWSAVTGATQYVVARRQGTAPATVIGLSSTPAFADSTATPGVTYQYAVRVRSAAGDGASSPTDAGWRGLSAPASVSASDGTLLDRVRVSWAQVPGATGYKVLRAVGSTTPSVLATLAATSTIFDDTTATPGTSYQYSVRAVCALGDGPASPSDAGSRANLVAPVASASDGAFTDKVRVTWGQVPGATGFKVLRAQGSAAPTVIATVGTALSHDDFTATPGVAYAYSVRAFNTQGDGPASATDAGWRAPVAPPSIFASDGTFSNKVQLIWSPTSGAGFTYKVLRGIAGGTPAVIASVSTPNFDDTSAVPGTAYNYSVRVSSPAGDGPPCPADGGWRALAAPATVNASDGTFTDKVRVTWSLVAGAAGYKVVRTEGSATPTVIATLSSTSTSYDDASVSIGVVYNYAVRSVSAPGDGPASANNTGWRAPEAPTSVSASDGALTDRVQVTWSPVLGATSYKVLRAQGDAAPTVIGTVSSAVTTFDDMNASVGVNYSYTVRASSVAGDGAPSSPDTGWRAPAAPETVAATSGTFTDKVRVVWSRVPGVFSYKVLRSSNSGPASVIASLDNLEEFMFNDVSADMGVLYTYTVRSSTPLGEGPDSAKVTGWRAPPAPQNLTATDGAQPDRVQLGWNPVPQGIGYAVYRAQGEGAFTQIGTASVGVFLDQSAIPGLIYRYAVRTMCAAGNGPASAEDTGWRQMNAPTSLVATDDLPTTIEVSWTADPGGVSFEIYRTDISQEGPEELIGTVPAAGLRFFEDTSAQLGVLYSYRVRTIGEPGTTASGYSDPDLGSLFFVDQSFVGGAAAGGRGKGYEPDATNESSNDSIDAAMGIQRYLETRDLEGEPLVDCEAVADTDALPEGDSVDETPPPAPFIDLDLNGEPDLCQLRRGDLDLSGAIDAGDIAVLLTLIGETPVLQIGDLDADEVVGPGDLQALLARMPAPEA